MPAPPSSKQQQNIKSPANTKSGGYQTGTNYSSRTAPKSGTGGSGYQTGTNYSASTAPRTGSSGSNVPMGFSNAQFGGQRYSPGQMFSDPDRSGAALKSVVNGINLAGGTPEQKLDSLYRNMGFSNPAARAGMIGTLGHESAGFKPEVLKGELLGDLSTGSPAFGLAQWRGDRQKSVKDYLANMGQPEDSLLGQGAFAGTELANSYPKAYKTVMNAQNPQEAVAGMNAYERPFGWKPGGNPANVAGWNDRVARANTQMGATAMSPTMASMQSPAAMPQAPQQAPPSMNGPFGEGWEKLKTTWNNVKPQIQQATQTINGLPGTPDQKAAIVGAYAKQGKAAAAAKYLETLMQGSGAGPFGNGRRENEANQGPNGVMQQAQAETAPSLNSEQQQQLLSLETKDRTLVQQYMKSGMTFEQAIKVIQGGGETAGGPEAPPPAPWQFPTMITRPYTRIA